MDFFRFLMSDVLSEPAVLVGLIALIGLIAQKKPVTECIKGTVKTIIGVCDFRRRGGFSCVVTG